MRLSISILALATLAACGQPADQNSANEAVADGDVTVEPLNEAATPAEGNDAGLAAAADEPDKPDADDFAPAASEPKQAEPDQPDRPEPKQAAAKGDDSFFDWTGRFAASRAMCRGGGWNLSRERVTTVGETACTVDETRDSSSQATLMLSCTAEGMRSKETWTLTRTGEGMRVRRNTGSETVNVNLVRCG